MAHIRRTTIKNRQEKALSVNFLRISPNVFLVVDDGSDDVRVFFIGLAQHMRVGVQRCAGFRMSKALADAYDILSALNEKRGQRMPKRMGMKWRKIVAEAETPYPTRD